jgi:hypothetical protein
MLDRFAARRAASATLFSLMLLSPLVAVASGPYEMAPLDSRQRFACARDESSTFVLWKTDLGASRQRSLSGAGARLLVRLNAVQARIDELEGEPSSAEIDAAIKRLTTKKTWLSGAIDGVTQCGSGELFPAEHRFDFLCRFGFSAPAVATRHECAVNLGALHADGGPKSIEAASWDVENAGLILDWLLGEACAREGGLLLRNTTLDAAAPLYNAYCAHFGARVKTNYGGNTLVLGMEEEATGPCIIAHLTQDEVDDGCGDYRPGPGTNGGGGGGGNDNPPPRNPADCIVLHMEEEATGCE